MSMSEPRPNSGEVTRLLGEMRDGSKAAEEQLLEVVYPELRRMASRYLRGERAGHTLQPTALVNEAYMQLAGQLDKDWQNRNHFFAVAAQLMRRILVDYARSKKAAKRDGGLAKVELTDALAISEDRLDEILAVDEALERLAKLDQRKARVVELRFFGGLTEEEVARVLGVDPRTVKRDWSFAKAWLHGEMGSTPKPL
jgi:RNA polymerase sigma-70 factor, ECF subfamily